MPRLRGRGLPQVPRPHQREPGFRGQSVCLSRFLGNSSDAEAQRWAGSLGSGAGWAGGRGLSLTPQEGISLDGDLRGSSGLPESTARQGAEDDVEAAVWGLLQTGCGQPPPHRRGPQK